MFNLPDVSDFGLAGSQTRVFVRKNGTCGSLKEVRLPPNSKLCDLIEKSSKVLDIECPQRAFYTNGVECRDMDNIEDDEVIHISCGEPFKAVEGADGRASQVVGNYILHEKLGQGGFGSVLKGVHSETGEVAAVKFVPKRSFRQISDLHRVFQEIQALRNLRHPNIIKIHDVADNPDSICFIMEFAAGGELRGYVEKHKSLDEEEARCFFKQIVRAVHYIHSKKIIHRDLKLENILLDASNQCKIVDFGLSDYVSSKERTVTDAGTEAYLAPEVYNGFSERSDPFKIDSWALGVILYAMTHGRLPFSRPDHETCHMLDKDGLTFNEGITPTLCTLIKAMLTPKPDKRASVNEISVDAWVNKNRFAACPMTGGFDGLSSEDEDNTDQDSERSFLHRQLRRASTSPAVSAVDSIENGLLFPQTFAAPPSPVVTAQESPTVPVDRRAIDRVGHDHHHHRAVRTYDRSPRYESGCRSEGLRDHAHGTPASPRVTKSQKERKDRCLPFAGASAVGATPPSYRGPHRAAVEGSGSSFNRTGQSPMIRRGGR
jgi:MAP/microtubule affinity-regulating kinase|mmetsp:Transcript_86445/g.135295  ORF Transcript_86445/g.135295 Transcript_86445/m.135295 type:complete len:545 (-) Transcript_86445:55-1689(-)